MIAPKPWKPHEDAFVRANWRTMTDPQMARELGRSVASVEKRRIRDLGLRKPVYVPPINEKLAWAVRRDWNRKHPNQIAAEQGVGNGAVYNMARLLSLGRNRIRQPQPGRRPPPVPELPVGYSPLEVEWARDNATLDCEARLMLIHHADFVEWVRRQEISKQRVMA